MIQYRTTQSEYVPYIAHYYGDQMRQLFMSAAALMLIGAPFYADSLSTELPFVLAGALALVGLGALANPHNKYIFFTAAALSGAGVMVYGMWALNNYDTSTFIQFILRFSIAIVFLVAFYFNIKTLRAFVLGKIGRHGEVGEFEAEESARAQKGRPWREEFMPWFLRGGKSNGGNSEANRLPPEATGPRMTPGRAPEEIKPKYHPYEDTM